MGNSFISIYERELKAALDSKPNNSEATSDLSESIRLAEIKAMFSSYLPDATKEEIEQVAKFQQELRDQQKRFNDLLKKHVIDEGEFQMASRREAEWSFRQCAQILGEARFERLFGVSPEYAANTSDELVVHTLAKRYKSSEVERKKVRDVWMSIDPIAINRVMKVWAQNSNINHAVKAIVHAENMFKAGEIDNCLNDARLVVSSALKQPKIGDTWLYLASWALHIQGRAYESLSHWDSATEKYEESLELKLHMKDWLPQGAFIATELKLGSVEAEYSPMQGIKRLTSILMTLKNKSKDFSDNRKMHEYFCVAGELKLANVYLGIGCQEEAANHARKALKKVRTIEDAVGEAQALFTLFRASEINRNDFLNRLQQLINDKKLSASNPKVSLMVNFMSKIEQPPISP